MSLGRRRSIERRSLLEGVPPSYHSTDDVSLAPSPVQGSPPGPARVLSRADLYWMLAGLWAGVLLGAFDGTVVATLLTTIGSEFNASDRASYIGTSYLLSVCCFTPLYGRLSDILGRKGAMLLALSLFATGTILCGAAPSMSSLIVARTIAGMGGGGVMTVSSIAVSDVIPLPRRGIYQGVANVLYGIGAAAGGPLGGWINDNYGWRLAFWMQTPFFLFSMIIVATKVNIELPQEIRMESMATKIRRIDYLGSLTLVGAVACLLLGVSLKTTEELPWTSPTIVALLFASATSAVAFVLVEKYWAPFPVMPMRLIAQRTPLVISLANLLASVSAFSMLYNAPLYFMAVRLESSALSGLYMLPHSIAIPTGSLLAGWLMRRTGKLYTLTLISGLSALTASLLASCWTENTSSWRLWIDLVPSGFGMASFITTTLIAMIANVPKEDMAIATGITYLFRTTGQVLGVSLSGAILQDVLLHKLRERIQGPDAAERIYAIRHNAAMIPDLDPLTRQAAVASYADALRVVFICQSAISVLAFMSSIPIQANELSQSTALAPPPPPLPPQNTPEDTESGEVTTL